MWAPFGVLNIRRRIVGMFVNRQGERYGSLLALEPLKRNSRWHWICHCDCGNVCYPSSGSLGMGQAQSCGCSRQSDKFKLACKGRMTLHGHFGTPEYQAWGRIIDCCENPKSKSWRHYGGRGITVAPEWREDPMQFIRDMGYRPSPQHSVERLDVDGPYAAWNCVWATPREQANNKRNNVRLTFHGRTQTMAQWARELGISPTTLSDRLKTRETNDAIDFHPIKQGNPVEFGGCSRTVTEWGRILGFSRRGLAKRLKTMSVTEAFTKPKREWPGA